MIIKKIDYQDGDTPLEGYLAYHETGKPKPAVLVSHDWSGRRELACKGAERIADMGYVGFALDMYGKGIFGADGDAKKNGALMAPFAQDRALLRRRINAALHAVRQLPQVDATRIAAMGYCFGGMCVLELARSGADVQGVISVHGIFAPGHNMANEPITAKVLCLHGHDDPMVPQEQVLAFETEMRPKPMWIGKCMSMAARCTLSPIRKPIIPILEQSIRKWRQTGHTGRLPISWVSCLYKNFLSLRLADRLAPSRLPDRRQSF